MDANVRLWVRFRRIRVWLADLRRVERRAADSRVELSGSLPAPECYNHRTCGLPHPFHPTKLRG